MLFKLSNLNSNFALTLGYLNPALSNSALINKIKGFTKVKQHESFSGLIFFENYLINAGIRDVLEMLAQLCGWMSIYVSSLCT